MTSSLQDRIIIVTGASGGLGRAIVSRAAEQDATVIAADVRPGGDGASATSIPPERVVFRELDVTKEDQWANLVKFVISTYGRIDGLINNAGVIEVAPLEKCTTEQWSHVMDVCALGAFLGCKHVLPVMKRNRGGAIVNVSSIAAMVGQPFAPSYCAAKGAVRSLTKAIAAECRAEQNGIRCNSVHPGGINTAMYSTVLNALLADKPEADRKRMSNASSAMSPEIVADAILYLLSDASRGMNGAEVVVDEGVTAS